MSKLVEYAKQVSEFGNHAVIFFGSHQKTAAKVSLDPEWPGLLICEDTDENTFMVEQGAIVAVLERMID